MEEKSATTPSVIESRYPGKYFEYNKEAKAILLDTHELIEGAKFAVSKSVSQSRSHDLSVNHGLSMGSSRTPPDYNFAITMSSKKGMAMGRVDTNGLVLWQLRKQFGDVLSVEATYQGLKPRTAFSGEMELKGQSFSVNAQGSTMGIIGASLMKRLTPAVSLGVSGIYHISEKIPRFDACTRFEGKDSVLAAEFGLAGNVHASYVHKMSDKLSFCSDLSVELAQKTADMRFGYEYNFFNSKFKGLVDSSGRVCGLLEEKLNPITSFLLSAEIDHSKREYRFGFGLSLGGSP